MKWTAVLILVAVAMMIVATTASGQWIRTFKASPNHLAQ